MSKSLFLLKKREDYSSDPSYSSSYQIATGMWNSSMFMIQELLANGRAAELEMLDDANSIDAAVTAFNPSHVIIEGLWVTPAKFQELLAIPRHAARTWIVRIHSEIPFLATEGNAMSYIAQYVALGVRVAPNAPRAVQQVRFQASKIAGLVGDVETLVPYLPNCYPVSAFRPIPARVEKPTIDVACFGAFRPLKNHLQQAFAAMRFAEKLGKSLTFHVNARLDQGGGPAYRNTTALFESAGANIVEHDWEDRETFLNSLANVDLLLQVSMSETFNIVAADATLVGTPILTSSEIPWTYPIHGDPQNIDDMLRKLEFIWGSKNFFVTKNRLGLTRYAQESSRRLLDFLPA